ncbi:HD domain-containing protein [Paraburkholderia aspalathi]|nr:HD domain-containing protein [Paraburkholderia aspalathi]MBK3779958.1 HD domain-containing protein [Paraburkholderia aspalathi]
MLFIGNPDWAEKRFARLMQYPGVPHITMHGLGTAADVQLNLLMFWTTPMLVLWVVSLGVGYIVTDLRVRSEQRKREASLRPAGEFWGVTVPHYSLGSLPLSTTPKLSGQPVVFAEKGKAPRGTMYIDLKGTVGEAFKMLTTAESQLAKELLQLLFAQPDHFAGLGHGVGLLEHTLNVAGEAAQRCTTEFRMPLLAALAHDVGKLITFQRDNDGEWVRRGLHSRESARILATLPGFQQLPEVHQRALMLAVKYDHAPNQIPEVRGEREATQLAMRVISALAHADRTATAAEKDRNLEKLKPEDLLWKDFADFLREAPVVQRGKKGAANQVNNPPDSPYLYVYEAPWRDAAVRRLPPEVAAALDLTRRDAGKMAKYTRILAERLRKEGLLVEEFEGKQVTGTNPLWDIQSGTGEKAVVLRGIMVLKADALWKVLNYRLSTKSPFPVQILAPNADADGNVSRAPEANREQPKMPDVTDGLKLDTSSPDALSVLGLASDTQGAPAADATASKGGAAARKRARTFTAAPAAQDDRTLGLAPAAPADKPAVRAVEASAPVVEKPAAGKSAPSDAATVERQTLSPEDEDAAMAAELAAAQASAEHADHEDHSVGEVSTASNDTALSLLAGLGALGTQDEDPAADDADDDAEDVPDEGVVTPAEVVPPVSATDPSAKAQADAAMHDTAAVTPVAKPAANPAPAAEPAPAQGSGARESLSMSERRAGVAIADAAALRSWPHLREGDKYYTVEAGDVKEGLRPAGSRYEGATLRDPRQKERPDTRRAPPAAEPRMPEPTRKTPVRAVAPPERKVEPNPLGMTESGPRRPRRRIN